MFWFLSENGLEKPGAGGYGPVPRLRQQPSLAGCMGQLCLPTGKAQCCSIPAGNLFPSHGRAAASGGGTAWCLLAPSVGILGPGSDLASIFLCVGFFFKYNNTVRSIFLISQMYIRQFDSKDLTSKINQNVVAVPTLEPRISSDLKGKITKPVLSELELKQHYSFKGSFKKFSFF